MAILTSEKRMKARWRMVWWNIFFVGAIYNTASAPLFEIFDAYFW